MNYFELLGLPVRLRIDKNEVRRKYLALSKANHPDFFVNENASRQQDALENFASLNKALATLSSQNEIIRYVLQLKGLLEDEEKYKLQPEFLMRMMEVNEALEDAAIETDPNEKEQLIQQLNELENEIYQPVAHIIESYEEGVTSEEELLQVKDYYFKKKYINRLRKQFGEKL